MMNAYLFNSGKFSDINISTDCGQTIKAHREILLKFPEVFRPKALASVAQGGAFRMPGLAYDVVVELIHFVYTGGMRNAEQFAVPLLRASVKLGMTELKVASEKKIANMINSSNFAEILMAATEYELHPIKAEIYNFISE
jgi:CMP-N-acetylneuraminic acid synthetase